MKKALIISILLTLTVSAYMVPITVCTDDGKCTVIYVDDGQ